MDLLADTNVLRYVANCDVKDYNHLNLMSDEIRLTGGYYETFL